MRNRRQLAAVRELGLHPAPEFAFVVQEKVYPYLVAVHWRAVGHVFNVFAIVQFLQYKPVGKWADYLRGERAYIILSLVAKSLLAWQVFSGTLVPPA